MPNCQSIDLLVTAYVDGDLAVLRVQDTPGPVLHLLGAQVDRGAKGAVLGYPGGGDLTGNAAALYEPLDAPIVHPVELLDWATGGPRPTALDRAPSVRAPV